MTLRSKFGAFIVFGVLLISAVGVAVISNENNQGRYSLFVVPVNTGPNLLLNPSFETGTAGLANNWLREYAPNATFSIVTSGVVEGNYAQHISYTGNYEDNNEQIEIFQASFERNDTYGSGDVISFSAYLSGSLTKCSAIIGIESFSNSGPYNGEKDAYLFGLTNTPQIFGVSYQVPINSTAVAVYIQINEIYSFSSVSITIDNASLVKTLTSLQTE